MVKNCQYCGKPFIASGAEKYCSATCRQEYRREYRKEWEKRTDYRAKCRKEAQDFNQEQLEAAEKQAKKDEKRIERNRKRREAYRRKKEAEKISANASGALARMKAADRFSYEYWEAYREYERGYAESLGRESTKTVNGISVNDDDFSLKVTISIEELGAIRIETE